MSMSRRILAVITCLVFVFACCGPSWICYAVFSEFAVGGLVADVMSFVVSVLIVAMGGAGLGDAINQAAADSSMPTFDFVKDKFEQFVEASGGSLSPLGVAKGIASSIMYNPDGTLVFENSAADFVSSFGTWLGDNGIDIPESDIDSSEIRQNAEGTIISAQIVLNESYDFSNSSGIYTGCYNSGFPVLRRTYSDTYRYIGFENLSFGDVVFLTLYNKRIYGIIVSNYTSNTLTRLIFDINNYVNCDVSSNSFIPNSSHFVELINCGGIADADFLIPTSTVDPINVSLSDLTEISSTGKTNGLDVWNDDAATDGYVMDPTALLGDAVSDLAGAVANIGDYVGTLADIIAGIADPALPVAGIGDVAIDPPAVIDPAIVLPIDPAVPADRAEAVPVTGENSVDVPTGTDDFSLPLSDFFPFCIPFDIYAMLHLLDATPEAPRVSWRFYVPNVCDEVIEIDLSSFDTVAQVLRTMEVLAFCVGLGFVTKRLLFGS